MGWYVEAMGCYVEPMGCQISWIGLTRIGILHHRSGLNKIMSLRCENEPKNNKTKGSWGREIVLVFKDIQVGDLVFVDAFGEHVKSFSLDPALLWWSEIAWHTHGHSRMKQENWEQDFWWIEMWCLFVVGRRRVSYSHKRNHKNWYQSKNFWKSDRKKEHVIETLLVVNCEWNFCWERQTWEGGGC